MQKNGGVLERFLKSLLVAIFAAVVAFAPAYADDACRNLFDISNSRIATVGTLQSDGSYLVSPWNMGIWTPENKVLFDGGENTQYTLSAKIKSPTTNETINITLGWYYSDGTISMGGPRGSFTDYTEVTAVSTPGKTVVGFGAYYFSREQMIIKDIQIERGSTATTYQPYNPLCTTCDGTVKESTNLFDISKLSFGAVSNTITRSIDSTDKTLHLNGTGDISASKANYNISIDEPVTMSITIKSGSFTPTENGSLGIRFYNADNQIVLDVGSPYNSAGETFGPGTQFIKTVSNLNATNVRFFGPNNIEFDDCVLEIQLERGTTATPYRPYGTTYCEPFIKIATTAYNTARFNPVKTDLNNAVATIREIVTKTINQTAAIASLQADKQTRPEDACPAGKKCLLVETEENGVIVPHWFPIIEAPE